MTFFAKVRFLATFGLLAVLYGCAMPKMQVESLDKVAADEVIVFGKVRLDPKISKEEVVYKNVINLSKRDLHESLYLKASDVFYDLKGGHALDMKSSLLVFDDEYYFFSWKKDTPFHLLGVSFVTHWSSAGRQYMTFTAGDGIKVTQSGKSRAIYAGTLTFERDEFFNLKGIKVDQSDYAAAKKAFQQKFGQSWTIEKAKLLPSK